MLTVKRNTVKTTGLPRSLIALNVMKMLQKSSIVPPHTIKFSVFSQSNMQGFMAGSDFVVMTRPLRETWI